MTIIHPPPGEEDEWSRLGNLVDTWQTIAGEALTDTETNEAIVALSDPTSVRAAIDYIDAVLTQYRDADDGSSNYHVEQLLKWARRGMSDLTEQLEAAGDTAPQPDTATHASGSLLWHSNPANHRQWTAADEHLGHLIIEHEHGTVTLHTAPMAPAGPLYPAARTDCFTAAAVAAQHRSHMAAGDDATEPQPPGSGQ